MEEFESGRHTNILGVRMVLVTGRWKMCVLRGGRGGKWVGGDDFENC